MKLISLIGLSVCAFCFPAFSAEIASLPAAEFDRGGLTYDFAVLSDRIFGQDASTNYFAGFSWGAKIERIHLFGKDLAVDAPVRKAVVGLPKWSHNGNATRVVAGDDILAACNGDRKIAGHLVNECFIYADLPDAEGGEYELRFRYACANTLHGARESYWMVGFADRPGAPWGGATWHPLDDFDGAVHEKRVIIKVWRGKRAVKFGFEFNGVGDFRVESVSLSRCARPTTPISVRYAIPDGIDGVFSLAEGQVGLCIAEWRANDDTKWNAERLRLNVELPAGVSLKACNFAELKKASCEKKEDGSVLWRLEVRHGMGRFLSDLPRKGAFSRHTPFQLMLEPVPGLDCSGRGSFSVTYDGKLVSNIAGISFRRIPRVKVAAPKRLLSGMNTGYCIFNWNGADGAQDALSQMMADAGMRIVHWPKWSSPPGCDDGMIAAMRKAGFTHLMPFDCSLCDGYIVADGSSRPANERFVSDIKTAHTENASCPIAIYTEMPHVMKYFTNSLPRILKGADGLWANWEPYFFNDHGCWCDRCREAFTVYSGLPPDEVKRAWPKEMMLNGRYSDQYKDFRSKEHAKVVMTVDKWVRKYTGGERSMGFAPGVAWCEMASHWRSLVDAKSSAVPGPRERSPRDYASNLEWIEPWGPYPRWDMKESFVYSKCKYLVYWVAAKDVREQLARDFSGGPMPKLMAYPSGKQGDIWVSQPEHLAMAFDAFYVNGWRSVVSYFFPMGYDARYWTAIAAVNERMAKYENWLIAGERIDGRVSAVPVAEYAMPADFITSYVPAATNVSMLQSAAFRLNGVSIVAVLNYWEKGEAFFNLKVQGLSAGRYALVDEAGVLYSKSRTEAYWTAEELAAGKPRLAVGAVRTRVFEIRPEGGKSLAGVVSRMSADEMAEAFAECRARLAVEAAKDHAEENARRAAGRHPPET
jgi:hypothetical protein